MKYAFNTFTLAADETVFVTGSDSLFTYQNTGNTSALIQGSNDAIEWTDIVTIAASTSKTATHSFKFVRLVGDTSVIANRGTASNTSDSNSGNGFSYGGEWDATGTEVLSTAQFNALTECVVSNNTITSNASLWGALAQNLSKTDVGAAMYVDVVWPDTSGGFFLIGLVVSEFSNAIVASNDSNASFVGVAAINGSVLSVLRNGQDASQDPLPVTINTGDIVRLGYRPAVNALYIDNVTQGFSSILQFQLYPAFNTEPVHLAIMGQLISSVNYTFPNEYSLQQATYELNLPSDFTKTYLVSNANINSAVNGKLLKQGDFVTFFENDNITDVIVSRLLTDNDINSLVEEAAQAVINQELQINGSIYNAIAQYVEDSTTGVNGHSTIQTAIGDYIQNYADTIGVGGDNQPYVSVMEAAQATISLEIQSGGIIDTAIQAAINP